MKKIVLMFLSLLSFAIILFVSLDNSEVQNTYAGTSVSTCSTAPSVFELSANSYLVQENETYLVSITFNNDCHHNVTKVNINGHIYNESEFYNTYYTNSADPFSGIDRYTVQIYVTYTEAIGSYFYVPAFEYVDLTNWLNPVYHVVNTNLASPDLTAMDDGEGINENPVEVFYIDSSNLAHVQFNNELNQIEFLDMDGETSMSIDLSTLYGLGVETTDDDGNTFTYDRDFILSMTVNGVGDLADFIFAPTGLKVYYIYALVYNSIENYSESDDVIDFAVDTAYDMILANDSLSDIVLNQATLALVETIQAENPDYVFPNDYMWIDGLFTAVLVDDDGNVMVDEDGEILIDEDGSVYGQDVVPEPLIAINQYLEQGINSLYSILGFEGDPYATASWIQRTFNFITDNWVLMVVFIIMILTSPMWIPFVPIIIGFFKAIATFGVMLALTLLKGVISPINYMSSKAKSLNRKKRE